jgi:ABC-2 type transport system permease protein
VTGAIYDIGYRRYDGARLGRPGALRALFGAGLRAVYGFGRPFRSKLWPFIAVGLALLPAAIAVALPAVLQQSGAGGAAEFLEFVSYDTYLTMIGLILPLFLASQAPELLVTDRRYQVLPLYFSRPISRADYVLSRWASLAVGLLGITLLPLLVLFVGTVLLDPDLTGALGEEGRHLPAILGTGVLYAAALSAVSLAVCAYAGRRAYAAAALIALFLVGGSVAGILSGQGGAAGWAALLDPLAVIDGARAWLFGGPVPESPAAISRLPLWIFGAATGGYVGLALVALAWRYRGTGV